MAQRRHHYEQAFERYLRTFRIPYVAVDEARKALLPDNSVFRVRRDAEAGVSSSLKSFDFVIYGSQTAGVMARDGEGTNLLVEVKGRRIGRRPRGGSLAERTAPAGAAPTHARGALALNRTGRLESWVTQEDVSSLQIWQRLFGPEFRSCFVFIYWCDEQPPDGLFQEIFDHRGRWYAIRAVTVDSYAKSMRPRSARWGTVHVNPAAFERISQPLTAGPRSPRTVPDGLPPLDDLADFGPALPALDHS